MSKPHIFVIVTDDLDSLSAAIMADVSLMPNLWNRIINPGVTYSSSFCTSPICGPSRATLLTGKYPHNHGVLDNELGFDAFNDFDTLATRLQGEYNTLHVGKYINGYGLNGSDSYVPPGYNSWNGLIDPYTYQVLDYKINHGGAVTQYGHAASDYQTSKLGDIAATNIAGFLGLGKPIFGMITPLAPHLEYSTIAAAAANGTDEHDKWQWYINPDPRDQTGKYAVWYYLANQAAFLHKNKPSYNELSVTDKPLLMQHPLMDAGDIAWSEIQFRTRLLSLLPVDDLIGKIAVALGSEVANAFFIFTSDNGYLLGEHRQASKQSYYEECIRVPLYIAGPGVLHHTDTNTVLNNDLYSTILELAGITPAANDGRSLVPSLYASNYVNGRKRFLVSYKQTDPLSIFDVPTYKAIRTNGFETYPRRTYVEHDNGDKQLFDIGVDPYQNSSLHLDVNRATEIAYLAGKLSALKTASGAAVITAEN